MTELTKEQNDTVRRAAFGAVALVSKAEPGFFAMFKESMAGSQAFAQAPQGVKEMLSGGLVAPPTGSSEQVESQILADLTEAKQLLAGDPSAQAGFRDVILAACQQVAEAAKGVSAEETAVIEKVRAAVS